MEKIVSGGKDVDVCTTCGAFWFDLGEIPELTEGRIAPTVVDPSPEAKRPPVADGGGRAETRPMARMHRLAATLMCPRCGRPLSALDFQATGVPVVVCRGCSGILVPSASAVKLSERFRFIRDHAKLYADLGASMADEVRKRFDFGSVGGGIPYRYGALQIPLPIVVPLSAGIRGTRSFPLATGALILLPFMLYLFSHLGGESVRWVDARVSLISGAGFVPGAFWRLLAYAFLPGALLPFLGGGLFLAILGPQLEERLGIWPFLGCYALSGISAGIMHLVLGRGGAPPALGSSGAVAGVLGAYLIFFPNIPIRMYGMGRVMSVPAYLFACIWIVALLVNGYGMGGLGGWVRGFLDPFPISIWGSLAGFGSGALYALAIRGKEEGII